MTKLLDLAIEKAAKLPEGEQDALAQLMLAELNSEKEWDTQFAASSEKLVRLAEKARKEYESGCAEELNPDLL